MITNIVAGLVILAIVVAAVAYLIRAKKRGVKCVGCSEAGCCSSSTKHAEETECCCGCHGEK